MFSSRNKQSYQRIDDDFGEETAVAYNSCASGLLDTVNNSRRLLFGGQDDEQQSLVAPSTSNSLYQDTSPTANAFDDGTVLNGPPIMASSSQVRSQRWDHIENLDEFFTHVYEYHQNSGYRCLALQKIFSLLQFIFIVLFSTFFTQCIDYDVLFANTNTTTSGNITIGKKHFGDAVIGDCASHLHPLMIIALIVAIIYWATRCVKNVHYLIQMRNIQNFYKDALKIEDAQLLNLTWHAVVKRICDVQPKLRLLIHSERMNSIDVYHRILRYKNYMVAMINKRVLDPKFEIPFIGTAAYLPNGLKSRIERLLFYSTTAPWDGPNLRDECKSLDLLDGLTLKLEKDCVFYGIVYLLLMPALLPFQILVSFFSLTDLIKRRPDGLGLRRYSNYGRYRVRHFNELEHELTARLNRSHIYAVAYMDQFFSPVMEIVAKNIAFVAAAIAVTLTALSAWDEDVLQVEHVLTVVTVSGMIILICRGMIPDENLVWQPEVLMTHVASELHYLSADWKGQAHTDQVRHEFGQLFQMKWTFFLYELSSPILTPFILLFWLRPRCGQLIRFFHDYTDHVDGLGDVCSFAILNVAKHGDPSWNGFAAKEGAQPNSDTVMVPSHNRALDGKTELSVLHFKTTNPEWRPPPATAKFLEHFRIRLGHDASVLPQHALHTATLGPLSASLEQSAVATRAMQRQLSAPSNVAPRRNILLESMHSIVPAAATIRGVAPGRHPLIGEGLHRIDGPVQNTFAQVGGLAVGGVMASLYQEQPDVAESLTQSLRASGVDVDNAGAEMRIQALFLRGLHDESRSVQQSRAFNYGTTITPHAQQSVFAMPEGFGRTDDSLIDVEQGIAMQEVTSSASMPRSRLIPRNNADDEGGPSHRALEVTEEADEEQPPEFFDC